MANKNDRAKSAVVDKLRAAFGEDYLGELGGKYYVRTKVDAEQIQVALALTVPKTQIEVGKTASSIPMRDGGFDFSGATAVAPAPEAPKSIMSADEQATIAELMARLGL